MLLQLYAKDTKSFKWNGEPLRHAYDDHVIRDDTFYLEFKLPLDKEEQYKKVTNGMIVKALDSDGIEQPFRVVDVENNIDHKKIVAIHVMYDLSAELINPMSYKSVPLSLVIDNLQEQIRHTPFTLSTGITRTRDYSTGEREDDSTELYNLLDVLLDGDNSIVGTWEAELLINGYDIRLVEKVGKRTKALVYEKKNIAEFDETTTTRDLITRIHAYSEFQEEPRETTEGEEPQEPKTIKLNVVVDSPLINEYPIVYNHYASNNELKTEQELTDWANNFFEVENVDLPKRTIEVKTNVIDGTEIGYGDYLILRYTKYDIDEEIRCVACDFSPIKEKLYGITLGSTARTIGESLKSSIVDTTQNELANELHKKMERVTHILMSANVFNRSAYGEESVPNPRKGDLWFKYSFDDPTKVALYIYDGEMWVLLVDDFTGARVEEVIKEFEKKIKEFDIKFEELQQRNRTELDEFKERLDNLDLPTDVIDNMKSQLDSLKERSDMTLDLIGNDGITRYNKNILKGEFKRKVGFENPSTEIVANDGGFKAGQTYTISFDAVCQLLKKSILTLNLKAPNKLREVKVNLKAGREALGAIDKTTSAESNEIDVYDNEKYTLDINSDWYQTISREVLIQGDTAMDIALNYREYVVGDVVSGRVLEWKEKPDLIVNGVINIGNN